MKLKEMLMDPKAREMANSLSLFARLLQKPAEQADEDVIHAWYVARETKTKSQSGITLVDVNSQKDREPQKIKLSPI